MSSVYTNNQEARNINIFDTTTNRGNVNIQQENQKARAISMDFNLKPGSVKLAPQQGKFNIFGLEGALSTKIPIQVFIYWVAKVSVDNKTNRIHSINSKNEGDNRIFELEPDQDYNLSSSDITISLSKYQISEISESHPTIPLAIVIKRTGQPIAHSLQSLTLYYSFDRKNNFSGTEISRGKHDIREIIFIFSD